MLVNCFSLHVYDNLSAMHSGCKKDPRLSQSTAVDMGERQKLVVVQLLHSPEVLRLPGWLGEFAITSCHVQRCRACQSGTPVRQDGLFSLGSLRWDEPCAELANLRFAIQHGDLAALEFQCDPWRSRTACSCISAGCLAAAIRRSYCNILQLWNPLLPRMSDVCRD